MQPQSIVHDPLVDLMLLYQAGDDDAFHHLVKRVKPLLCRYFARRFNDHWLAEDLAQVVLMRVFRARGNYKPTARFLTWLYFIADNVYKNHIRYLSRRDGYQPEGRSTDVAVSYPDGLEEQDRLDVLRSTLSTLKLTWRRAFQLQLAGCGYAEIGRQLGLSVPAVKSMLSRARAHLRSQLVAIAPDDFAA